MKAPEKTTRQKIIKEYHNKNYNSVLTEFCNFDENINKIDLKKSAESHLNTYKQMVGEYNIKHECMTTTVARLLKDDDEMDKLHYPVADDVEANYDLECEFIDLRDQVVDRISHLVNNKSLELEIYKDGAKVITYYENSKEAVNYLLEAYGLANEVKNDSLEK